MSAGVARTVAGRYRLVRELGRGGMGAVWHAHDELLGRDVAVKEIHLLGATADSADPSAPRVLREARAAAQLKHPGIITVHDVVVDDGRPWIVMELVGGSSLSQVIDDGVVSERRAALIGLRVLDALGAAHRNGVLHRDVKPPNILLDGDRVVLTDFGIAAIRGATALTATGQMIGSPAYLAPERINGAAASAAGDLWALGVTLYAAVTGRSPFQRDDVLATFGAVLTTEPARPDGADRLWPVIRGLLAKDPGRRMTAKPAAEPSPPVRTGRASGPVVPLSPGETADPDTGTTLERQAPTRRGRRTSWIAGAALFCLVVAGAFAGEYLARTDRDRTGDAVSTPGPSSASRAPASASVPPSAAVTPSPPAGFRTVQFRGAFTFAVPEKWTGRDDHWNGDGSGAATAKMLITQERVGAGESALTHVTRQDEGQAEYYYHRRIRLAATTAPAGGASAAEWEYTTTHTNYSALGYGHSITRAVALPNGEIYLFTVFVDADTRAALDRDWARWKPTLTRILDSVRRAG
ncbi:hypothetical protein Aph02nite_44800 [Actinoplanes philippinensis]|uniref:non-specific serine/threonine protein kinase n=1 Tax=Actinoplanes philippinensis TaxID=35752 RepID=A0A1I2I7N3_9ACTN|nr:serine/threonine-protein kinase [Actinoplanes philippinensis]GIE78530.1 hypothetical protein Aph02nite_44800 [Actinoplanes philippinensis]SFF38244.1 Serine/threonine protein kinase [Actinoplanes philippinensis]